MSTVRAVPRITVEGLHKVFVKGGVSLPVLRGVDLVLEPGERVAILGQSGSGKSTFLHILGTLDRPSAGTIRMGDRDVFARSAGELDALRNQEIGFVFQFHHLLPDQDALRNVMLPGMIAGRPLAEVESEAAAMLGRVGLGARLRHKPGELSGGEQQRVALARALVRRPSLLLADEPTGNLDARTAEAIHGLLLDLHGEVGSTLVVVTHDASLAARFPRRLRLVDGQFAAEAA